MSKGVIVSDPHIGDYPYGRTDTETGLNTRLLDFLQNFNQSIDFAIKKEVDFFIIVGDIYRLKHPNSKIRRQFAKCISKLKKSDIRVILMTGNHDMTTSADGAHAMSEMQELCDLIADFEVYSQPKIVKVKDTNLYILPFVNRGEERLLTVQEFNTYQADKIKEFNESSNDSKAKYNLFFGHFGTDKSVMGNSFDLDMSADENENKIRLSSFDDGNWTKVYLGHIHKQQEFNKVARHVGSIGRVDFSEESEEKGFYYFDNGDDNFITIQDRRFVTFRIKFGENHVEVLKKLKQDIESKDLTESIVRIKAEVEQTYLPEIRFNDIETYLKENTWHSLGVDLDIIGEEQKTEASQITVVDLPNEALKKHIELHPARFKNIEKKAYELGTIILQQVKSKEV